MTNVAETNAARKKVGRPSGRKAPHRPVLSISTRVSEEEYAEVAAAAEANNRTLSEEGAWRLRQSFVWERELENWKKAHESAQAMLDKTRHVTDQTTQRSLENELRRRGYRLVRGLNGAAWFEPGVDSINWIYETSTSRELLEDLTERVAVRALQKFVAQAIAKPAERKS